MDDRQCIMIDVIKDVFNVEKLDGAMREFGDFELTLLKVNKRRNDFMKTLFVPKINVIILRIKKTIFSKKSIQFFEIEK